MSGRLPPRGKVSRGEGRGKEGKARSKPAQSRGREPLLTRARRRRTPPSSRRQTAAAARLPAQAPPEAGGARLPARRRAQGAPARPPELRRARRRPRGSLARRGRSPDPPSAAATPPAATRHGDGAPRRAASTSGVARRAARAAARCRTMPPGAAHSNGSGRRRAAPPRRQAFARPPPRPSAAPSARAVALGSHPGSRASAASAERPGACRPADQFAHLRPSSAPPLRPKRGRGGHRGRSSSAGVPARLHAFALLGVTGRGHPGERCTRSTLAARLGQAVRAPSRKPPKPTGSPHESGRSRPAPPRRPKAGRRGVPPRLGGGGRAGSPSFPRDVWRV